MADCKMNMAVERQLTLAFTKCLCAFALLLPPGLAGLAQQAPCTVPAVVQRFDLSSFPEEYVDRARAWRQKSSGGRAAKPGQLDMGEFGYAATDDWTAAQDLPPHAFVARDNKRAIRIQSVEINRGPRNIVFVADNGKAMSAPARKIEAALITDILSKARQEDSFGFLTARGPRVALGLGSHCEMIKAAAEKLQQSSIQGESDSEGVLDALLEATTWLEPQRPGDTIFLLAMRIEGKHKASVSKVRAALGAGRIRLFGFQLGPKAIPGVGDVVSRSVAQSSISGELVDGMFSLSSETGGVAGWENTEAYQYELKGPRLQRLGDTAEQMYNAITEYYVLELSSVTPHLSITLSSEFQKKLLVPMDVLYPHDLPPCRPNLPLGRRVSSAVHR